jgi:hypothetical protein
MPLKQITLRRWEVAGAFLFNVVAIVVVTVLLTHLWRVTNHQARQNNAALCALRNHFGFTVSEIDHRLKDRRVPKGAFDRQELLTFRDEYEQTYRALGVIRCPPPLP